MTNSDPTPDTQACGGDVAAYALGALDASEATAFRAHLAECIVCRDELMAFQNVVDLLPITTTQHRAPRALRGRVLRGIQNTPEPELSRDRPWRGWRLSSASRLARPALALGGAVAVLVFALAGSQLGSRDTPRTKVFVATVIGSTGTARIKVAGGRTEMIVRHFPPPPAGQVYEVWVRRGSHVPTPTSALFSVVAGGNGDIEVPGGLRGVNQVMVTPEPPGGSRVPTHAAVIRASI